MGFQNFRGRGGGSRASQGGFRRGSRGGYSDKFQSGPPEEVVEVGVFAHPCQEDIVCKITSEKIPYSNAPVYLANKEEIGKVDEVFGPIKDAYFSIKLSDTLKSKSFQEGVKFFMDPAKFLTLDRVMNPNSSRGQRGGRGRGDQRGGRGGHDFSRGRGRGESRGARGDFRGGRGGSRGRWSDGGGHSNRGGFRGGREMNGQRGGERHSFGGKRGANFSASNAPQSKKFKSED